MLFAWTSTQLTKKKKKQVMKIQRYSIGKYYILEVFHWSVHIIKLFKMAFIDKTNIIIVR